MARTDDRGHARRIVERLSALLLGLLAGAMLAIAVALVPWWTALPPAELQAWFRGHAPRIGRLMFPLGAGAAVASLAGAVLGRRAASARRGWLWGAGAAAIAVVIVTALVNEPINEALWGDAALSAPQATAAIARWSCWHVVRVGFGLVGFWAALRALDP
jgi:hypothetical protein